MKELQTIFDADAQDAKIATARSELSNLKHDLLLLEMQLVDQMEVMTRDWCVVVGSTVCCLGSEQRV